MELTKQLANRFIEVILNGRWIADTNYKDQLTDLTWQQATTKIEPLNTIADLALHINYYIEGVLNVLEGGELEIKDKHSFDFPPITSQSDWEARLNNMWRNTEKFALLIESMNETRLNEVFIDEKYGSYQRNIEAMIEHSYYHLGQITLIKKMILKSANK